MKTTIFQYRYNFETKTGEVKIDREYRQKCPRHGGKFVPPLVGELGGAKWVMMKVQKSILKKYYGAGLWLTSPISHRSRNSTGSSGDSWDTSTTSSWDTSTTATSGRGETSWNNSSSSSSWRQETSCDIRAREGGIERRDERKLLPLYKPLPSHSRENCEACLLRRCPFPR